MGIFYKVVTALDQDLMSNADPKWLTEPVYSPPSLPIKAISQGELLSHVTTNTTLKSFLNMDMLSRLVAHSFDLLNSRVLHPSKVNAHNSWILQRSSKAKLQSGRCHECNAQNGETIMLEKRSCLHMLRLDSWIPFSRFHIGHLSLECRMCSCAGTYRVHACFCLRFSVKNNWCDCHKLSRNRKTLSHLESVAGTSTNTLHSMLSACVILSWICSVSDRVAESNENAKTPWLVGLCLEGRKRQILCDESYLRDWPICATTKGPAICVITTQKHQYVSELFSSFAFSFCFAVVSQNFRTCFKLSPPPCLSLDFLCLIGICVKAITSTKAETISLKDPFQLFVQHPGKDRDLEITGSATQHQQCRWKIACEIVLRLFVGMGWDVSAITPEASLLSSACLPCNTNCPCEAFPPPPKTKKQFMIAWPTHKKKHPRKQNRLPVMDWKSKPPKRVTLAKSNYWVGFHSALGKAAPHKWLQDRNLRSARKREERQ